MLIAETNRLSRLITRKHPLVELRRSISFFIKTKRRARHNALIKAELNRLAELSPHLLQDVGYVSESGGGRATPRSGDESLDNILNR